MPPLKPLFPERSLSRAGPPRWGRLACLAACSRPPRPQRTVAAKVHRVSARRGAHMLYALCWKLARVKKTEGNRRKITFLFWQKVTVSVSNRGKLPVRRNGCTLTMQLPVGKIASLLGGILLSTGLLGLFLYSTGERQAQNPADRLTSGAGPRERSNKRRWRRAAKKPGVPLGRERRRARLYPSNISRRRFRPLGTLWLRQE